MLLERSELNIKEGSEPAFADAMNAIGITLLEGVAGVTSVSLGRGIENPSKFILLIEWDSMEAHIAFTKTPAFTEFRGTISPYSVGGAMEHFEMG